MPDDVDAATDTTAPVFTFPFDVPADLSVLSEDALRALHAQVREHAGTYAGLSAADHTAETLAGLRACRDLALQVADAITAQRDKAAEIAALSADLDEPLPEPEPEPEPEPDGDVLPDEPAPTSVTAANARRGQPRVRNVARNAPAPQLPADTAPKYATLKAASSLRGFTAGDELPDFMAAARMVDEQLDRYRNGIPGSANNYQRGRRPITVYDASGARHELRNYNRTQVARIVRDYPAELRVDDQGANGYSVAKYAAKETRLPGGSLRSSMEANVKAGRSLTAAAGWCAPSDVIYGLVDLSTLEGLLDLPELQTTRGGWQYPENGGPDFSVVWDAIGNSGDTHLTEDEVISDTPKVSTEIPCPDFIETRLGVDYYSLTGGLLQRRGYPEAVAEFLQVSAKALEHKINKGVIADMVAGSGAAHIIPTDPSGDDAVSALLSGVELAIEDGRTRFRMGFQATMEVPLPHWVLVKMRAAMARRYGIGTVNVTDAMILEWFTTRGAVPRFVYDWQDSFGGLATGPGAATPLTVLPQVVEFLVYPAGTWVKAVEDVISLDTIYDSTLLTTNQYVATFVETGWAVLKMQPLSRRYAVTVDASGVTGCCPGVEVS